MLCSFRRISLVPIRNCSKDTSKRSSRRRRPEDTFKYPSRRLMESQEDAVRRHLQAFFKKTPSRRYLQVSFKKAHGEPRRRRQKTPSSVLQEDAVQKTPTSILQEGSWRAKKTPSEDTVKRPSSSWRAKKKRLKTGSGN